MRRTLPRALRACSVPAMDLDLVGRRAALMASSDGIGKAIACALAREGVHVMMSGRDADKLAAAVEEAKAAARRGRAGRRRERRPRHRARPGLARRERAPAAFGGLDILLTNTGGPPAGPLLGFDDDAWQSAFESVLLSVARGARAALPAPRGLGAGAHRLDRLLLDQGDAPRARLLQRLPAGHPRPRQDARRGARPEGHHGQPDRARQDRHRAGALARRHARRAHRHERCRGARRLRSATSRSGRYGEPGELAEVAVFLCSKAGRYVSGTATLVDGGLVRAL